MISPLVMTCFSTQSLGLLFASPAQVRAAQHSDDAIAVTVYAGVAFVDVRLDVVPLPPRSSSPTVAGCRLGGSPVGRDRWGEERVVGGVLPRISVGTWGLCDCLCLVLVCRGRYGLGGRFFSSFWDRVWAE